MTNRKTKQPTAKTKTASKATKAPTKAQTPLAAQKARDAEKLAAALAPTKPAKAPKAKAEKVVAAKPIGKPALTCGVCGRGFKEHSSDSVCPECFEIAGIDNGCNDESRKATEAELAELGQLMKAIGRKDGDVKAVMKANTFINWKDVVIPEENEKLAAAVSKSWLDKATHKARCTRNAVRVGKDTYRSVREAFVALKLPLPKHQKFRKELKAAGTLAFEGHKFVLVKE